MPTDLQAIRAITNSQEIAASAGIKREVKLYLPLTAERQAKLLRCPDRSEIRLTYFKGKQVRVLARATLRELGRLVSGNHCFSPADLARAEIKRAGAGAARRWSLEIKNFMNGERGIVLRPIKIPLTRPVAKRLSRERDGTRRAKLIFDLCGPVLIDGKRVRPEDFTSARLRSVVQGGGRTEFYLDFKGRRHGSHRICRAELTIRIPQGRYAELLPKASGGFIAKTRYHQDGVVRLGSGALVRIQAEIDVLREAGGDIKGRSASAASLAASAGVPEFALAEVELPRGVSRNGLLKGLFGGEHSLSILRGPSHSLSFRNKSEWECLGMRKLALDGLNPVARGQLAALRKRCRTPERTVKKVA